jgi:ATP synthase protein I
MEQLVRAKPVNKILRVQLLALIVFALLFSIYDMNSVLASVFGSFVAIANTLIIKKNLHQAAKNAGAYANKNLQSAYKCVAERWGITIALFAIGFGIFKFEPVPFMGSFALTQFVVLIFGQMNRA